MFPSYPLHSVFISCFLLPVPNLRFVLLLLLLNDSFFSTSSFSSVVCLLFIVLNFTVVPSGSVSNRVERAQSSSFSAAPCVLHVKEFRRSAYIADTENVFQKWILDNALSRK